MAPGLVQDTDLAAAERALRKHFVSPKGYSKSLRVYGA